MKRIFAIIIALLVTVGIGIGGKIGKNINVGSNLITGPTWVVPCGPDDGEGGADDGEASF